MKSRSSPFSRAEARLPARQVREKQATEGRMQRAEKAETVELRKEKINGRADVSGGRSDKRRPSLSQGQQEISQLPQSSSSSLPGHRAGLIALAKKKSITTIADKTSLIREGKGEKRTDKNKPDQRNSDIRNNERATKSRLYGSNMKARVSPALVSVNKNINIFNAKKPYLTAADAMMPQGLILEMKGVVEGRPYFNKEMKPEEVVRAIVEIARQMHWVFSPEDEENQEVLKVLLAVASEAVNAQTGDSKAYKEIARLFVLLAKGANQPGTHATVLNYVPTPADLRALVLPVIENKNARVEIFITPEAITNEEGRAELAKRIQEVEKLAPGGRAQVRYQIDWVSLYQSVLDSAQKTYKDLYPKGEIKFETFLERSFVLSLPEELSQKAEEFDAKIGKGLRSVIYSIPKEGIGKRAAYLVLEAGVATKLAQEVLSRLQEKEYFNQQGSHYFLRNDVFAMVEAIWRVFEASKWISAAA